MSRKRHVYAKVRSAFTEAWERGPEWQRLMTEAVAKVKSSSRMILEDLGLPFAILR